MAARNLAANRFQGTTVQADTRRARNQESMASRLSEETAGTGAARRESERLYEETIVPGGQETKSERAANRQAGERVASLEVEVSDFGVFKLSLGGRNIWKLTAGQRSFRDWCSGG